MNVLKLKAFKHTLGDRDIEHCAHISFQNCIFSFQNSLDPDQLASNEAS